MKFWRNLWILPKFLDKNMRKNCGFLENLKKLENLERILKKKFKNAFRKRSLTKKKKKRERERERE